MFKPQYVVKQLFGLGSLLAETFGDTPMAFLGISHDQEIKHISIIEICPMDTGSKVTKLFTKVY